MRSPDPPLLFQAHVLCPPQPTAVTVLDTPLAQGYSSLSLQLGNRNSCWGAFPARTLISAGQRVAETCVHRMRQNGTLGALVSSQDAWSPRSNMKESVGDSVHFEG